MPACLSQSAAMIPIVELARLRFVVFVGPRIEDPRSVQLPHQLNALAALEVEMNSWAGVSWLSTS